MRIDFLENATVTDARTFGTKQPSCMLDMSTLSPDLHTFVGEIVIPKFPYDPVDSQQTNPGG